MRVDKVQPCCSLLPLAAYHSVMLSAKPLRESAPTNHLTASGLKSANTKSSQKSRQDVYTKNSLHYGMWVVPLTLFNDARTSE